MKVLLDTDILSELLRAKNEHVTDHAARYRAAHGPLTISVVTVIEVARGWHQAGRPDRAESFKRWVAARCKVLPCDTTIGWLAGEIAGALARAGRPIGLADVCIAATAITHSRSLATGNASHFEHIRSAGFELELVDWRSAP